MELGKALLTYLRKWSSILDSRDPSEIKDADAFKAYELVNKLLGNIIERHEVTIKKSLGEEIEEYLNAEEGKS